MYDYNEIYAEFKDKITDPDLALLPDRIQEDILLSLLRKAINKTKRAADIIVDLDERDDDAKEFFNDVPYDVVDCITEWMVVFWLKPMLNNTENMHNLLSTRDYNVFSPANLLGKIQERYDRAYKEARSITNELSYAARESFKEWSKT